MISHPRNSAGSQPHLHVDSFGRVCFLSIRRPCPLLEVDPLPSACGDGGAEPKLSEKLLEKEPMLEARITIEDGLCLLLDVDDIDPSLQLVYPLGKSGNSAGLAAKDDIVFLHSLSFQRSETDFKVPAAHLTWDAAEGVNNLAKTVSACVTGMDLISLNACLAAVVFSSEQPPLRPLVSPAGDGASNERLTYLSHPIAACNFSMPNPGLRQASFDAFFVLLTKYCVSKYDSIVQSIFTQGQPDTEVIGSEAVRAVGKEMPVGLLRASLPHTNERQRKLLNFDQ
ncbi:Hypothetical predicted protein [Olea europaea subsp. europaea]|uniref:Uncharacterized protein n=1 Tax=Olea europaea subsp. europaea TaxID=158383 RepID=A0A8S0R0H3_OLEEU|nr:Hypothetical predicted protein [Olea europaea subsp. europaea]